MECVSFDFVDLELNQMIEFLFSDTPKPDILSKERRHTNPSDSTTPRGQFERWRHIRFVDG